MSISSPVSIASSRARMTFVEAIELAGKVLVVVDVTAIVVGALIAGVRVIVARSVPAEPNQRCRDDRRRPEHALLLGLERRVAAGSRTPRSSRAVPPARST